MQHWKPIDDWKDLPVGSWLVKVKKDDAKRDHMVADVFLNGMNQKLIIAGGMFYFDAGDIEAYSPFEKYNGV